LLYRQSPRINENNMGSLDFRSISMCQKKVHTLGEEDALFDNWLFLRRTNVNHRNIIGMVTNNDYAQTFRKA